MAKSDEKTETNTKERKEKSKYLQRCWYEYTFKIILIQMC